MKRFFKTYIPFRGKMIIMKTTIQVVLLFMFLFSPNIVLGQCKEITPNFTDYFEVQITPTVCDSRYYKLIFSEDFNGDSLDTNIWLNGPAATTYPLNIIGNKDWNNTLIPENVKIQDGIAHLEVHKLDEPMEFEWEVDGNIHHEVREYSAAMINLHERTAPARSHQSGCFRFGKFSVRAKITQKDAANCAFWFYGWADEVDVFELFEGAGGRIQATVWQHNVDPVARVPTCHDLDDLSLDYHVYTFEWTPYEMIFYVDGIEFRTFAKYYQRSVEMDYDEPFPHKVYSKGYTKEKLCRIKKIA